MSKNLELSAEQKLAGKCGFDYIYADFIKVNTPDSAVILMPSFSALYPSDGSTDFNRANSAGVKNKAWATYFLYPRKLVYPNEVGNKYADSISYIAVANYVDYAGNRYNSRYAILGVK
jgi:hypothetical protein